MEDFQENCGAELDETEEDEMEYLLCSPANAKRILDALTGAKDGNGTVTTLEESNSIGIDMSVLRTR